MATVTGIVTILHGFGLLLGLPLGESVEFPSGGNDVLFPANVEAVEHAPRLVSDDSHHRLLFDAGVEHIPDGRSAEVVKQQAMKPGRRAGGPPGSIKASGPFTLASCHMVLFRALQIPFRPREPQPGTHLPVGRQHAGMAVLRLASTQQDVPALQVHLGPLDGHQFPAPEADVVADHKRELLVIGEFLSQRQILFFLQIPLADVVFLQHADLEVTADQRRVMFQRQPKAPDLDGFGSAFIEAIQHESLPLVQVRSREKARAEMVVEQSGQATVFRLVDVSEDTIILTCKVKKFETEKDIEKAASRCASELRRRMTQ